MLTNALTHTPYVKRLQQVNALVLYLRENTEGIGEQILPQLNMPISSQHESKDRLKDIDLNQSHLAQADVPPFG